MRYLLPLLSFACIYSTLSLPVQAQVFSGIYFPNGVVSFADEVIRYDPLYSGGPAPTDLLDPLLTIGVPEGTAANKCTSLGRGGLIELKFTNNVLVNSGDSDEDLHIFELGPDVEDTFVAIRPTAATAALLDSSMDANSDGFYEVGKVFGAISSVDIDAYFPGFEPGQLVFDAVQLVDDYYEGDSSGRTVGADIDSVGAIGSVRTCKFYLAGDVNSDCTVNLLDFAQMAANWLIDCNSQQNDACVPIQ